MTAVVTVFHARRLALTVYLLLGAGILIQGLATATYFVWFDKPEFPFGPVIFGLSAFMVALGGWFASYSWRRLRDPQPPITIGPAGLHDRIVSTRPIPWRHVSNLAVHHVGRGGNIIIFDLAPEATDACGVRRRMRAMAMINKAFGYSYRLHQMGTDATPERLVAAIQPHAAVANMNTKNL